MSLVVLDEQVAPKVATSLAALDYAIEHVSTIKELGASSPMFVAIANEIGFLSPAQAVAFRRAVTLDMEMRIEGKKEKAAAAVEACREALSSLSGR